MLVSGRLVFDRKATPYQLSRAVHTPHPAQDLEPRLGRFFFFPVLFAIKHWGVMELQTAGFLFWAFVLTINIYNIYIIIYICWPMRFFCVMGDHVSSPSGKTDFSVWHIHPNRKTKWKRDVATKSWKQTWNLTCKILQVSTLDTSTPSPICSTEWTIIISSYHVIKVLKLLPNTVVQMCGLPICLLWAQLSIKGWNHAAVSVISFCTLSIASSQTRGQWASLGDNSEILLSKTFLPPYISYLIVLSRATSTLTV